jgi:hypothetical protein
MTAPARLTGDWTVTAAGLRFEPERPPQFAVDLLRRPFSG